MVTIQELANIANELKTKYLGDREVDIKLCADTLDIIWIEVDVWLYHDYAGHIQVAQTGGVDIIEDLALTQADKRLLTLCKRTIEERLKNFSLKY